MKYLKTIHKEFTKQASEWSDLSIEAQREYLQRHPKSKRKLNAKSDSMQQSESQNIENTEKNQDQKTKQKGSSFTFKTTNPSGRFGWLDKPHHDIKVNKKVVGSIVEPTRDSINRAFKVKFMIVKKDIMEDRNPNCDWKWMTLKKDFTSVDEAKEFVNKYFNEITEKYPLHSSSNDE